MAKNNNKRGFAGGTRHKSIINDLPKKYEYIDGVKAVPSDQKALYYNYLETLVKKTNQEIYNLYKINFGIDDFVPIYVEFDRQKLSIRTRIRGDFLKEKLKMEMSFHDWLKSTRRLKGHKDYQIEQYEKWIRDPISFKQKPHWLKKLKKEFLKDYTELPEYRPSKDKGVIMMRSNYKGIRDATSEPKMGTVIHYKENFNKQIQSTTLKKLFDPDNEELLWGDVNMKNYLKGHNVDMKKYNKIMKKVLESMWDEFENINLLDLTKEETEEYRESFQPKFPNIVRIRDWFITKGIYDKPRSNYTYTLERFRNLKSNTQRANFIDRAVFLIANSIYMGQHGISPVTKSLMPRKNAGMKASIKHARRFKRFSQERKKYATERTKNYEQWRLDNRKLAANLKRADTRNKQRKQRKQT